MESSESSLPTIIRPKLLAERLGISRVTLWRWERAGMVPKKRKIGPNTVGWLESEILEWLESRPTSSPTGLDSEQGGDARASTGGRR
ncbi:MAG: AlpA family phage regulatory protein [Acidobacteriota bacterium]|nr:AlpA family phage regulatory protein [Acidobacteriota bacterium]